MFVISKGPVHIARPRKRAMRTRPTGVRCVEELGWQLFALLTLPRRKVLFADCGYFYSEKLLLIGVNSACGSGALEPLFKADWWTLYNEYSDSSLKMTLSIATSTVRFTWDRIKLFEKKRVTGYASAQRDSVTNALIRSKEELELTRVKLLAEGRDDELDVSSKVLSALALLDVLTTKEEQKNRAEGEYAASLNLFELRVAFLLPAVRNECNYARCIVDSVRENFKETSKLVHESNTGSHHDCDGREKVAGSQVKVKRSNGSLAWLMGLLLKEGYDPNQPLLDEPGRVLHEAFHLARDFVEEMPREVDAILEADREVKAAKDELTKELLRAESSIATLKT